MLMGADFQAVAAGGRTIAAASCFKGSNVIVDIFLSGYDITNYPAATGSLQPSLLSHAGEADTVIRIRGRHA